MNRLVGHVLGLLPALYLLLTGITGGLGANPIEWLTRNTGTWAFILLLASLAVTPLVKGVGKAHYGSMVINFKKIMPWRRLLGLYAFFYALTHFSVYLIFDLSFDFSFLWADIQDRPYITVGFLAFIILLGLALTSSNFSRKKLGRNWLLVHKSVYVADALVLLHFFWLIKADFYRFWWYAAVYIGLMSFRFFVFKR